MRGALRADFSVRGVWEEQRVAYFDNRILNADAPSRLERNTSWKTTLNSAANEKRNNKYKVACEDIRASFTPLVCTTDGCFTIGKYEGVCVTHSQFFFWGEALYGGSGFKRFVMGTIKT